MKLSRSWTGLFALVMFLAIGAGTMQVQGALGPYGPDANTLQLWHLDEPAGYLGTLQNAVPGGLPLQPYRRGADPSVIMGATSYTGFDKAANLVGWRFIGSL